MSTLVLVVVTLAVAGAITYILMKKGTIDSSNGYTVKSDCYNLKINQLKGHEYVNQ
jgi:hypothetical protein